MFEVGKKYNYQGSQAAASLCLAVYGDDFGWMGGHHSMPYTTSFAQGRWYEVPSEPKRWSTWQNVYSDDEQPRPVQWGTKAAADNWSNSGCTRVAYLRRDFEQHEEKEAVCVNCELEKIDA